MAECMHKLTIRTPSCVTQVSCKRCIPCRKRRAAELKRFCELQQQEYYKSGLSCSFNCLTYTDRSLPVNSFGVPTIRKSDFQKFMKRFRKNLSKIESKSKINFKYLACGEYGDSDFRPHYHFILFGLSDAFADKLIRKSWMTKNSPRVPLGRCDVRPLTPGGISYVCDYVITSLNGELAKQKYDDNELERPFTCHSQGLGIDYLLDNQDDIINNNFVDNFSGKPFLIPKYYRDYYNLDLSHSFNSAPILERIHRQAAKYSLSDSAFQTMQQQIAVKNARLETIGSSCPVEIDNDFSISSRPNIVPGIVDAEAPIDEIPF